MKPAGRPLMLIAMPAVSTASYVRSIRLKAPAPAEAPRSQEPGPCFGAEANLEVINFQKRQGGPL
jgi:hypothetical protein